MSPPSPGPDVEVRDRLSHDCEAQPEPARRPHEHESQNLPMNMLPYAEFELPQALEVEEGRQRFIQKMHTWIPGNRRTSLPRNSTNTPAKEMQNRDTYTSFGDRGTTASVSAHGHLLQICQYLGIGRSGFFCVDQDDIRRAWVSNDRLATLLDKAKTSAATFGIDWQSTFGQGWDFDKVLPHLEFVDDRWPRFTSSTPDAPDAPDAPNTYNQSTDEDKTSFKEMPDIRPLSKDFSLLVQYFCNDGTIFQRSTLERKDGAEKRPALAPLKLRVDLLIRNLDFTEQLGFNDYSRDSKYTYRLGSKNKSLIVSHQIPKEMFEEMGIEDADEDKKVVLTIRLYVNGELQALQLDRDSQTVTMRFKRAILDQVDKYGVLDVLLTYSLRLREIKVKKPADWEAMMKISRDDSYEKISFSSHLHLDYLMRRNLEHILSVCSIPVAPSTSESNHGDELAPSRAHDSPIALTCGDISGHRVGVSASFYALQFLQEMYQYLEKVDGRYPRQLRYRIRNIYERHLTWVFESTDAHEGTDASGKTSTPQGTNTPERTNAPETTDSIDDTGTSEGTYPVKEPLAFSAHYWANGKPITNTTYLPEPSLVDTPLQVLKIFHHHDLSEKAKTKLSSRIVAWLQGLDEMDERKKYAFARMTSTEEKKFHLVDHVRISQALSKINEISFDSNVDMKILQRFDKEAVRNSVLKRFITENPISKQRMFATSRTSSETRFLLHSKDTALFHAMDSKIFSKKEASHSEKSESWRYLKDEWRNTIECQVEHEETQVLEWRKPLWYAISVILASKQRQINKQLSAERLFSTATQTLLDISSPSGLFPGFLTEDKGPMHFEDETYRDNYWQTTFEIPFILWKYGKAHLEAAGDRSSNLPEKSPDISGSSKASGFMAKKLQFAISNKLIDPKGLVEISDDWLLQGPEALDFRPKPEFLFASSDQPRAFMSKLNDFPTNSDMVASSAWSTYSNKGKDGKDSHSFTDKRGGKALVADIPRGYGPLKDAGLKEATLLSNECLEECLGKPRDVQLAKKRLIWLPKADQETALICCLASPSVERSELSGFFDRHALYDKYFSDETSATSNEWKTELHLSFHRLAEFAHMSDFCQEEGIPAFSYVVPRPPGSKEKPDNVTGIVRAAMGFRFVGDFFDRYWTCHFLEYTPGNPPSKKNSNDSLGRKDTQPTPVPANTTDDRSQPHSATEPSATFSSTQDVKANELVERISNLGKTAIELENAPVEKKKYPWQQRKVLELLLLDLILDEIKTETEKIFNWARDSVLKTSGDKRGDESRYTGEKARRSVLGHLEKEDNRYTYEMAVSDRTNPLSEALDSAYQFLKLSEGESYFSLISRWRLFEKILETLGEDLSGNLDRISEWTNREEDREPESPRWTRNDERLFRNTINKLRVQNQRKVRDLERLNVKIQTFCGSLTGRLESIREDKSFKGSENMSLFTYVTVVFLPLGFATGIFSMSEAPGRLTLAFMVATAIISLSITLFALANAELLDDSIVEPLIKLAQSCGKPLVSLILFAVYSLLFVIFSVQALLRPLFNPVHKYLVEPMFKALTEQKHLEDYRKRLHRMRTADVAQKAQELMKRRHDSSIISPGHMEAQPTEHERVQNSPQGR